MYGLSFGDATFDLGCTEWPKTANIHFSEKLCEIETSYVLLTYMKSCMGFLLLMWPSTSDAPNDPKTTNAHFSQKLCEIETSFVLLTYRKSCMAFHLLMSPLTSDVPNDSKTANIHFSLKLWKLQPSHILQTHWKSNIGFFTYSLLTNGRSGV